MAYRSGRVTDQQKRPFVVEGNKLFVPTNVYVAMKADVQSYELSFAGNDIRFRPTPRLLKLAGMSLEEIREFLKTISEKAGGDVMDLIPDPDLVQ